MTDADEAPGARTTPLRGRTLLVVEDNYVLARELCVRLASEGAGIIGPAATVDAALDLLGDGPLPSCAVLDINLRGQMAWPVADALLTRRIPLVFVSGYGAEAIPRAYARIPRCEKPVDLHQLVRLLVATA